MIHRIISACLCVLAASLAAGEKDLALPKNGRTVDPPFSDSLPEAWTDLPLFGEITWEVRHLPWVTEGPYAGISGAAIAAHNDRIYVVGGFIPAGDQSENGQSRRTSRWTWVCDTKDLQWRRLADSPLRREYTRGVVAGNAFYLMGGGCQYRGEDPPYRVHGDVAVLDLSVKPPVWREHSALNVPRTHTAVGVVHDSIIVAGGNEYDFAEEGYSPLTIRETNEVLDLSQPEAGWQQRQPIPGPGRGWSAFATTESHLYVFGGLTWRDSGDVLGLKDTLRYDPTADRWEHRTAAPLPVSGWDGALYAGRYVLMTGGVVRSDTTTPEKLAWSDVVWAYDIEDDRWFRVEGFLPPGAVFNDPGVVVIGDTMYVLGAEGPHGSHYDYFLVGHITPAGS